MRNRVINILFIASLIVLIIIAAISIIQIRRLVEANYWVTHTYEVITEADSLLMNLFEAESSHRGYLIVGDEIYLNVFNNSLNNLNSDLVNLKKLAVDNPAQIQRIQVLQDLINQRITAFRNVITAYKQQGAQAAYKLIQGNQGSLLTQQIKQQFQAIINEELVLLKQRTDNLLRRSTQTNAIILLGNIFSILLFLTVYILFSRQLKARKLAEENAEKLQSYLKGIIEGSKDLIAAVDRDFRFIALNSGYVSAFKKLFGKQILINMSVEDAFSQVPSDINVAYEAWKKALGGEEFSVIEKFDDNSNRVYYEISYSTIRDNKGEIIGATQMLHDVTERVEKEETLQQTNKKLETSFGELKQSSKEMQLLTEMSRALQSCITIKEAYAPIKFYCEQMLPNTSGILYVMHPSHNYLESTAIWGEPISKDPIFSPEQCWALRRGQIYYADNLERSLRCEHVKTKDEGEKVRYICIPLVAQNETLGLLYLELSSEFNVTSDLQSDESTRLLLNNIAEQISLALANIRLRETLRYQSIRDPLTGLFNRRYLKELLDRDLERAERKNISMALIMIDIDHFKRFNDTYGHEAGDMVLREMGRAMNEGFRGSDIACRYGGEEFLLFLYDTSLEVAEKRAEELSQKIKHIQIKYGATVLEKITISQGIAMFPENGTTAEELIEAADKALYKAKHEGRDRIVVYKNKKNS